MKKVLVLTVIAILALGVMALADHVGASGDLEGLTANATITVEQWIDATPTGYSITISDYLNAADQEVASLAIESNAPVDINVKYTAPETLSDLVFDFFDPNNADLGAIAAEGTAYNDQGNGTYEVKMMGSSVKQDLEAQQNSSVTFTFDVIHTVEF